jgi:hypothetical protein
MGVGESFRTGNIYPGMALGEAVTNVTLSADNTVVNPGRLPFLRLTSDNATATSRTFSLTNGSVDGQILHICLVGGSTFKCELLSTGNVLLTSGTWTASVNDYLELQWDQLSAIWREVSRDQSITQTLGGTYTPTMTVGTNVVSASALPATYQRVGNTVYVSGQSAVVTTSAANTASIFYVSLPVASNLAATTDLAGNANRAAASGTAYSPCTVIADVTNDRAEIGFNSTATASSLATWTFSYTVL